MPLSSLVDERSHVLKLAEVESVNSSDQEVLTVVTSGRIDKSFLNELPSSIVEFYRSSLAYLDDASSATPSLLLNANFYFSLDEGARDLYPDRRLVRIPLKKSSPNNYSITAIGAYAYNEKLIALATEGVVLAISSKDP